MTEILSEHFWAIWWLVVIVALIVNDAVTDWAKYRSGPHDQA